MEEFKVGDIVQLKSGGPKMTVADVSARHVIQNYIGRVGCQWFAGNKSETGYFPKESLRKVSAESKEA